ncbi:hypothetical protein [Aeromicrobium fastidiosum]|uniref:Uncharacterized protein n=1 Tax=Aeromicrobium fastidiosum TaxID=52699 RepID=A0A641ARX9_9ACTN|nr:hypothetical protein [Aeromicrobium fastidiosum]KAA1380432.1 hypothetical protein ESP62_004420 [Aeromicrobium fastidiosum]MBP2390010.1 hypothetical protein [Aeromicrobium fastidiosum]
MTAAVTREMVLAAATGLRAGDPATADEAATDRAVRAIIAGSVPVGTDLVDYTAYPTSDDVDVIGVLIDATLTRTDTVQTRSLATVALAPADDDATLDGSVLVRGLPMDAADGGRTLHSSSLSGDVHVTAPVDVSETGVLEVGLTSGSAAEAAAPAPVAPAPTARPRTTAELKAARTAYDAAVKKARTKYAKARKKAGKSKRRRIAAKKAYDTRRARAKATYRAAIADVPVVGINSPPASRSAPATASSVTIISTDVAWPQA